MASVIVISDDEEEAAEEEEEGEEEEEEAAPIPAKRQRRSQYDPAPGDLIDLTGEDSGVGDRMHSDVGVIDLTRLDGVEDFLSSLDCSLGTDCVLSCSEDDCWIIKESSSPNTSIPDVHRKIFQPLQVPLMKAETSLDSNSLEYKYSETCSKIWRRLSGNGTAVNRIMNAQHRPFSEGYPLAYVSSRRSGHTSPESPLGDLQDSNFKSSFITSPAQLDRGPVNVHLCHRTSPLKNPVFDSSSFSVQTSPHISCRESCDSRDSVEDFPRVFSSESCGSRPSVENSSCVSTRESCQKQPSIKDSPYVSSREPCDNQPSVEDSAFVSSRETESRSSVENSSRVSTREPWQKQPSVKDSPHVPSREPCDNQPSVEDSACVSSRETESRSSVENSSRIFSRESCDSRSSLKNPPHVSSQESCDRPSLGTLPPSIEQSSTPCIDSTAKKLPLLNSSSQGLHLKPLDSPNAPMPEQYPHAGSRKDPDEVPKASPTPGIASRAWLNKLKYFRKLPVQHIFFQGLKLDEESIKNRRRLPAPISDRRLNMVHTTIEEEFPQGTVQFLMEFVSPQHYPKKDIVSHVIRKILLCGDDIDLLTDAYTVLMRIQQFHPANPSTVGWDWSLLSEEMGKQDKPCHLPFLRYVLQTLEDDFHTNLVRRSLQKSIAKTVLSCDQHFSNVRNVIQWLISAVNCCSTEAESGSSSPQRPDVARDKNQMVVVILQQMLTMAVEVDKSPTISSNRIADTMFPYVLSIRQRCQRETFFNTMVSHLLRGKLLEVMFCHSCETLPTCTLSRTKILLFLKHSMLLLDDQGGHGEWQRWDEMLHYLYLLFISYETILFEHLRSPLTERVDLTIQRAKAPLMEDDIISKEDVDQHLKTFCDRISQGQKEIGDAQLWEKIQILRTVLYTVVHCPPP